MISESASLILPFHQEMDEIREDAAEKVKLVLQEEELDRVTKTKLKKINKSNGFKIRNQLRKKT